MTAPTREEIHAAVLAWLEAPSPIVVGTMRDGLRETIGTMSDVLDVAAFEILESSDGGVPDGPGFWRDLRPSEALYLREQVDRAKAAARRSCEAIIVRELVAAGMRFAERYPEAPRQPATV
jgi:hypothetical protein